MTGSARRGRTLRWSGAITAGAATAGLAVYLVVAGLDEADKVSSVIALFVGLAGLALTLYDIVLARRGTRAPRTPEPRPATGTAPAPPASPAPRTRTQINAPGQGGTVNAVQDGTMHIHHGPPPPAPPPGTGDTGDTGSTGGPA